ncbi:MAG: class II fructose-bisphosphate aldolase [Verrucomicrobiota bacterium]|nr:class II fructose-bisphosphate aldolase [Verrucomicrobiota bacterium]
MIEARSKKVAIGAFECWNSANIRAVAEAAAECRMPVIFQATSLEYAVMGGADAMRSIVEFYVNKTGIDAAIHLDHGSTLEQVQECMDAGFTSVMMDASRLPLEENIALSKKAAELAHVNNLAIETELGHVGGSEGGLEDAGDGVDGLTDSSEAERFVAETGTDCLAVGIGTAHGDYKRAPNIDLKRLEQIAERVSVPLVLHGGSGTPVDLLLKTIDRGIAKINICTDIHKVWLEAITEACKTLTPSVPGLFHVPPHDALKAKVAEIIKLFACGKTW